MRDPEPRNGAKGPPQVQPAISFVGSHTPFHPAPPEAPLAWTPSAGASPSPLGAATVVREGVRERSQPRSLPRCHTLFHPADRRPRCLAASTREFAIVLGDGVSITGGDLGWVGVADRAALVF